MLALSLVSCKLFDREEKFPAYIGFAEPTVIIDSATGFSGTYGVKDFWVYQGAKFYGAFPYNTYFPITDLEPATYLADAGIFESGVSSFRLPYPFWEPTIFSIAPNEGDTILITPELHYYNDSFIVFSFLENFENSFIKFQTLNTVDSTNLVRSTNAPFEGTFCVDAFFDSTHQILDIISEPLPPVEKNTDIYAEITFKSDFPLRAGIFYYAPAMTRVADVELVPKQEWTTVFIHLVKLIRDAPAGATIYLWIYSDGQGATGKVSLDHIRVVHFKET